jgi:signal transduction histidine kinase
MTVPAETFHAPATRSSASELAAQAALFAEDRLFTEVLNRIPTGLLILNAHRQIVYANQAAVGLAAPENLPARPGLRPGEFVGCIHARSDSGCGTTQFCRYCGAVKAILQSQAGQAGIEECRILVQAPAGDQAVDLRVWTAPLAMGGQSFTFLAFQDIGDEKRRLLLEHIFLHDLRNTTSALKGFLSLLVAGEEDETRRNRYLHNLNLLSDQILEEIQSQRVLLAAENGELALVPIRLSALNLLRDVFEVHIRPDLIDGRRLAIDSGSMDAPLENDPAILKRVLGNMVKNAIEASVPGETVMLGCGQAGEEISFWVQNPTYMPENIRLQVFNRSFSTKGIGRGLGTYSMKLLTDHYLGGRIGFTSTEPAGTRFTATFPQSFRKASHR